MLTQDEKDALGELKAKGYSFEKAMSFIGGQRLNSPSSILKELQPEQPQETTKGGFGEAIKDVPSDILQAFTGARDAVSSGITKADTARTQVEQGAISPLAGTAKTIGAGLQAGAEVVGQGVMGIAKLFTSPKTEEGVSTAVQQGASVIAKTEPVQALVQKYESLSPEQKALVDGALGTAEGLGTILGASPAIKALKTGVTGLGDIAKTGFKAIDDVTPELKGITLPSTEGITKAIDLGFKPEQIMQRVARVNKGKQAAFEQAAGESIGEYLVKRDIFGTPDQIADQLYKRMSESKGKVDESLATVQGRFKADSVKTALTQLVERDAKVSTKGALSPDSKKIEELYKRYNQGGLTLSEVNEVKRLFERNVRVDYLSFGNPNAEGLARSTNIDSALRNLVEDKATKAGITTVKELNRETRLAKQLLDDIGAEYAGSAGNNAIGLTDTIFLAESLGNPVAAAGFVAKKLLSNKGTMSAIAKLLSKNAGTKAELPATPKPDEAKLTGYLKFLDDVKKGNVNLQSGKIANPLGKKPEVKNESESLMPSVPKFPAEVKSNIVEIIDDYRLNGGKNLDLQEDAARIAEDYNIPMPKNYGSLVEKLQQILDANN